MKRNICTAIFLFLTTSHLYYGLSNKYDVPAWTMFSRMPLYTYELYDNTGRPIDIRKYVLPRAYTINTPYAVLLVGRWYEKKFPMNTPLSGNFHPMEIIPEMRTNLR